MTAFLWVAACWLVPFALLGLWVFADWFLDRRYVAEQEHSSTDTTPEWLALLAAVEPEPAEQFARERQASLNAHPSAKRVLDRIAANEAARLDAEWEAMNR